MMLQKSPAHKLHVHRVNSHVAVHSENQRRCAIALVLLCFVWIATPVYAQPKTQTGNIPARINAANQLVRDGEIQSALDAYSAIKGDSSSQPQLDFNRGVALYRNGDIAAAQKLFTEAAGTVDDHLAANASYNLGNCLYSQSLKQMQQPESKAEPAQLIEQLRKAISHYRGSLRSGESGSDARANIELAAELIRQLEQKQEQEKQDQEKQGQNQQNEDQQQQDQSQSENDSEQQQNEAQSEQEQQQQQGEQPEKEQNQDEQKPGEQKPGEQKQGQQKQGESSGQSDPEDASQTDQAEQKPANPEGELKAANGQKQQDGKPENAVNQPDDSTRPMTREEAMKMLQAIRDRDMIRRFQQQQRERSRQIPVEKDW